MCLRHKKILFGISGGIAAYKAPDLLHGWVKMGCEVETILTESAEAFVSPMVLSTLSKRRVWRERDFMSPEHGWRIPHISLTDWADLFVIAPCTGATLARLAEGLSDTPVTLAAKSLLRVGCPVVIAVSTNDGLGASGENIARLYQRKHYYFVPYGQDDPNTKPQSLKARFELLPQTLEAALEGRQLQPVLQCPCG